MRNHGFTLIELSIVLIIIGLIIGGVLVGQDMIKSAEIRATLGQLEKYQAAVNTFSNKYNGLPGDLNPYQVSLFGFTARTGAAGHGDGRGVINGCFSGIAFLGCEITLFWRDLSDAQLIEGSYTLATDAVSPNLTSSDIPLYFPSAKLGRGIDIAAYSSGSPFNYFAVTNILSSDGSGVSAVNGDLTPQQAWSIDAKLDDGYPMTGKTKALKESGQIASTAIPTAAASGVCVTSQSGLPYNTSDATWATVPSCGLSIQW